MHYSLGELVRYMTKLGTIGFGGPVALVGYMHRDLVERRRWLSEELYSLALALAQIMPGPLAAQTAIAIGYFQSGIVGATRPLEPRSSVLPDPGPTFAGASGSRGAGFPAGSRRP